MAINQYENLVMSKVTGYLNVRSSPEDKGNANIIGKMTSKAGGEILETLDGWYKVKSGPIIGYISSDPQYTATGQEAKDIAMQTATKKAVISTDVLNVRTEPNTDAKIWTQIVKDEKCPVVDDPNTPDGWIRIDLDSVDEEDGGESDSAYISTRDNNVEVRYVINEAIKFKPADDGSSSGSGSSGSASRRSQVVNYALQFVGNPYVWGGTSLTKGADCSGFTMKVMEKFGVSLPHYSGSQAKMGKKVTSANMKPGDLIFYVGSNGRVNHVWQCISEMARSSMRPAGGAGSRYPHGTTGRRWRSEICWINSRPGANRKRNKSCKIRKDYPGRKDSGSQRFHGSRGTFSERTVFFAYEQTGSKTGGGGYP